MEINCCLQIFNIVVIKITLILNRFTPENKEKRHPYAWLPFGVGPRNCVGMRLALIELKMAAVTMIQNFTVVRCDETEVHFFLLFLVIYVQ